MNESVQWALIVPLALGVVAAGVQLGVGWQASTLAHEGASAAAEIVASGGAVAEGVAAARRIVEPSGMTEVRVQIRTAGGEVTATVEGSPAQLLPLGGRVSEQASFPKEQV